MTLTFIETRVRNENWTWHYFQDEEGFRFFVKEPSQEIKEKQLEEFLLYQEDSELYQIRWHECITLSKEQVAENWYNQIYKKGKTTNIDQLFADLKINRKKI